MPRPSLPARATETVAESRPARELDHETLAAANHEARELAARRRRAHATGPTLVWSNAMAMAVTQLHGGVRETLLAANAPGSLHAKTVRGLLLSRPAR